MGAAVRRKLVFSTEYNNTGTRRGSHSHDINKKPSDSVPHVSPHASPPRPASHHSTHLPVTAAVTTGPDTLAAPQSSSAGGHQKSFFSPRDTPSLSGSSSSQVNLIGPSLSHRPKSATK